MDLYNRTKRFAVRIISLYKALPNSIEAQVIEKQILRSGTSVGAQFFEAKRSRSKNEFESKLQSALQEIEETGYWLDLLLETKIFTYKKLELIIKERNDLTAILVASINSSKSK